jgi:putative heme-binding domain-containing protein
MPPLSCWSRVGRGCAGRIVWWLLLGLLLPHATHAAESLTERLREEPANSLIEDARGSGDSVRGAVLFADRELGCAVCHVAGAADRLAPDLRQMAADVSDSHLLESLLYPSREIAKGFELSVVQTTDGRVLPLRVVGERDGMLLARSAQAPYEPVRLPVAEIEERAVSAASAMPEGLPNQLRSRQEFLDLLLYLFELRDRRVEGEALADATAPGQVPDDIQGAVLFDRYGCRGCHSDQKWRTITAGGVSPDQAPSLNDLRQRFRPEALVRYLTDPQAAKPGARMPHLLANEPADRREPVALELTHYLLSRGEHAFVDQPVDADRAQRGGELFHRVGCVACHAPLDPEGQELLAASSVSLEGVGDRWSVPALIAFLEEPTAIRPGGRMPSLQLTHEEAVDLAHALLATSSESTASAAWAIEAELARAGEAHYQRLRCNACHEPPVDRALSAVPIRDGQQGCLSGHRGEWPLYTLTEAERRLLVNFCSTPEPVEPQPIVSAMATLRCYACHQRDGLGGVDPDRDSYFTTADFNLGQQGRLPPHLTGVGEKLRPEWLRQVLVSGRSVRPSMHTRMPRFGLPQVEPLVGLLTAADDQPDREWPREADPKELREAGHQLAGTKGLNCIACHTFQRKPAATMSAVDLTEMTERLQHDWFVAYMFNPQLISPGTVMPSFWPGGKTVREQILGGDPQRQLAALWTYLEEGRQARAPEGLVVEPLRLVATDETVMLRRSWPGVGKRGIGVGYVEQVNLVFDAEQMRLAMLWKGEFADPGGVWRSQGHGTVRPLGGPVVKLGEGPDLTNPARPWVASDNERRPPGAGFLGYELDELRRPRLRYRAADMTVEEFFCGTAEQTLRRTVVLTGDNLEGPRQFRLLVGAAIEPTSPNRWQSDTGLSVTLIGGKGVTPQLVATEPGQELRVELPAGKVSTTLEMEYAW